MAKTVNLGQLRQRLGSRVSIGTIKKVISATTGLKQKSWQLYKLIRDKKGDFTTASDRAAYQKLYGATKRPKEESYTITREQAARLLKKTVEGAIADSQKTGSYLKGLPHKTKSDPNTALRLGIKGAVEEKKEKIGKEASKKSEEVKKRGKQVKVSFLDRLRQAQAMKFQRKEYGYKSFLKKENKSEAAAGKKGVTANVMAKKAVNSRNSNQGGQASLAPTIVAVGATRVGAENIKDESQKSQAQTESQVQENKSEETTEVEQAFLETVREEITKAPLSDKPEEAKSSEEPAVDGGETEGEAGAEEKTQIGDAGAAVDPFGSGDEE